jgi:hypothetical protein
MNDLERFHEDGLTLTNADCAALMGISESRFYQLRAAQVIPDALLSPIPGRWSLVKVRAWLAEGQPAVRRRRSRESAA